MVSLIKQNHHHHENFHISLKLIKGETEPVTEEELNISPELTRELLVSALKLIARDRANRVSKSSSSPKIPVMNVPIYPYPQPCGQHIQPIEKIEEQPETTAVSDSAQASGNGRRAIVTTATGIATNPLTGLQHYVQYPVVYPTYRHPYQVYG